MGKNNEKYPAPDFAVGRSHKIIHIPDPEAVTEVDRTLSWDIIRDDLRAGNFVPGTIMRTHGQMLCVVGPTGQPQIEVQYKQGKKTKELNDGIGN